MRKSKDIDLILGKHEQSVGHMAQGFARASGKPGIALVSSASGATNVVTPLQDALSDGTPLVVFYGHDPIAVDRDDAFHQGADIIGITRACTKWNVAVTNVSDIPRRISEAFTIATSGRPGPVLLSLPSATADTLKVPIGVSPCVPSVPYPVAGLGTACTGKEMAETLERVARLINTAKKPVIYAGQGVILSPGGPRLLKELAERCSIPVTTTLQGLGAYDELDERSLHMLGMHGSGYANMAMQEADLILALGARFDDRATMNVAKFAPAAKIAALQGRGGIIQFEIAPKNINKVVQATEAVEGDLATNLDRLLALPSLAPRSMESRKDWFEKVEEWKRKWPLSSFERLARPGLIKPQVLIEKLSDLVASRKDTTYITTGVGQHQMWAAQHFRWRHPRSMITSGGLGTMGYGLPAAIGAKVAHPEGLVIDIDGDASFSMTLSELTTASQFNIGIKVIILNNEEQGMVTQLQNTYYEDRYAHAHHINPDFARLGEAMHVQSRRLTESKDIDESLKWLIDSDGPALLEVITDKKVPVLPTVPAGGGLHEFLVFDDG